MNIKDILTKAAKGETLTEDERKTLASYDPDNAAAAARRKAEQDAADAVKGKADLDAKLADLQAKLDEANKGKMTAGEQAKAELDALKRQIGDLTTKYQTAEAEKAKLARQSKVDGLIQRSGIKFVDGLDATILTGALAGQIAALPDADLDKEDAVKPILEKFRAANKAAILDTSGHGAGTDPARRVETGSNGKPVDQQTAEERAADLKKKGII